MNARLQFGTRTPGRAYVARPGAYAVALDRARGLLCVRAEGGVHLPGGGLRRGEDAATAVLRELREETGCEAEVVRLIGRANQYVLAADGAFNKQGAFFVVRLLSDPRPPHEHEPLWLPPAAAARRLAEAFQRWAVQRVL